MNKDMKNLLGVSFSETEYIIMCYTFSEKSIEIITKIIRALTAYYMNCQKYTLLIIPLMP